MDIMQNLDCSYPGIMIFIVMLFSYVQSRSMFDIMITSQPKACSSFINHVNYSITDPSVIYPPAFTDKVNYEYVITTPNFPKNYPTNIQCISLIKAPSYEYNIVIEVREKFELEPSKDCLSDFLEINDGPYGFSKSFGKFCSSESMPKEIVSTGPFMWLRFVSDSSLPHAGFKIVYRFIKQNAKPIINYCYKQTIIPDDDSFNLNTSFLLSEFKNSTRIHDNASIPVECVFDFYVNPEFNTFFHKSRFIKQKNFLSCQDNFLEIFHSSTVNENIAPKKLSNYYKICEDEDFKERLFTKSYRTSVRVSLKDISKIDDFKFIINPIKEFKNKCSEHYSRVQSWCISNKLLCNMETNCPDGIDEKCVYGRPIKPGEETTQNSTIDTISTKKPLDADTSTKSNQTHAIILSSITIILILCMVVCLVITIHSKKKDHSKNRIHLAEFVNINDHSSQTKRLFHERLQSSKPISTFMSSEKLSQKDYGNNSIWSKRITSDDTMASADRNDDSIFKLNGGITIDSSMQTFSHKSQKIKIDKMKNSSMNKIGKYLSVPNPSKNDSKQNSLSSNNFNNQINFGIILPSDDLQSISSQSYSKHNSNNKTIYHHIQRASSMGSGLRKQLLESSTNNYYSKNIEWYCGPVIRSSSNESSNRNDSSDILNAYSAKSSTHVPGCRSLPNVNYIGLQNQLCYSKPIPTNNVNNDITDSMDLSCDDNSSYKEETVSIQNNYIKDNSYKLFQSKKNLDNFRSNYGFKYFCAHEPSRSKDFVEYIA